MSTEIDTVDVALETDRIEENPYGLAVDRVFTIARGLANIACLGLTTQPHLSEQVLDGIETYVGVSLAPTEGKGASTKERCLLANEAIWKSTKKDSSESDHLTPKQAALIVATGGRMTLHVLREARLTVLKQDTQQPQIINSSIE